MGLTAELLQVALFFTTKVRNLKDADQLESGLLDENIALKAKILELERRIQVLESIVTDKNFRLEQEINSLDQ